MNAPIITQPARPPLSETPFSPALGDVRFMPSQHLKALAVARERTRTRGCKQQVRLADICVGPAFPDIFVTRWIVQDVR